MVVREKFEDSSSGLLFKAQIPMKNDGRRMRQKPVSAAAKPLGSVPPFSRRDFSVQDGARQKCPEPSGNKLSESFFKNYLRCL